MTSRVSPEALIGAAAEVALLKLAREPTAQPYAVDLTEQTGGNVLVVVSFMGDPQFDRFHVDQLGVVHR